MIDVVLAMSSSQREGSDPPDESGSGETSPSRQRPAILVVDDDVDVRDTLELVLGDEGFDVTTTEHGGQAIKLLRSGYVPDLVILDLMMPVRSGWEVWDELQGKPTLALVPVIVYTATGLGQGAVGSATVLGKNASMASLLTKIRDALKLSPA